MGVLIILALNWERLGFENPVKKTLCILIRRLGSRTEGEGPNLIQPGGIPITAPVQQCVRSGPAGVSWVSWRVWVGPRHYAQMTGWAAWATSPGLKEKGGNLTCPARLPLSHHCVWGENRPSNYDNLELGLPGTRPHIPPEGSPGSSAGASCPKVP